MTLRVISNINRQCARVLGAAAGWLMWGATAHAVSLQWHGLAEVNATANDNTQSFLDAGVGNTRYDEAGINLGQLLVNLDADLGPSLSASVTAHYQDNLDHDVSVTEAFIRYAPLSRTGYRWRARAGLLYPTLSLENTDKGWISPHVVTNSAINTWVGEEVRLPGVEVSFSRNGRRFRSPWSWDLSATLFRGNDASGSLLAWRGWAMHDRQVGLGEQVPLAGYLGFTTRILNQQAPYVEPIDEIDGRWGYALGANIDYVSRVEVRWMYLDNNADTTVLSDGQWAWDTRFHHLAVRYRFSDRLTFKSQWMTGSSFAGRELVDIDFDAAYLTAEWEVGNSHLTLRYDNFSIDDRDTWPLDTNTGNGHGWTLAWHTPLHDNIDMIVEWSSVHSDRPNRTPLTGSPAIEQDQLLAALRYRW